MYIEDYREKFGLYYMNSPFQVLRNKLKFTYLFTDFHELVVKYSSSCIMGENTSIDIDLMIYTYAYTGREPFFPWTIRSQTNYNYMYQQFLSFTIKKKSDASTSTRHKNKQCHLSCVCRAHQDCHCCLQHNLLFTKAKIYPVQAWLSMPLIHLSSSAVCSFE